MKIFDVVCVAHIDNVYFGYLEPVDRYTDRFRESASVNNSIEKYELDIDLYTCLGFTYPRDKNDMYDSDYFRRVPSEFRGENTILMVLEDRLGKRVEVVLDRGSVELCGLVKNCTVKLSHVLPFVDNKLPVFYCRDYEEEAFKVDVPIYHAYLRGTDPFSGRFPKGRLLTTEQRNFLGLYQVDGVDRRKSPHSLVVLVCVYTGMAKILDVDVSWITFHGRGIRRYSEVYLYEIFEPERPTFEEVMRRRKIKLIRL